MRDKKQKPTMLILFLISFAVFTVLSFLGSRRAYRSYALELNIAREPALSMLFRGIHDGVFPWNNGEEREEPLNMEKAEESFFFHISDPAVEDQEVLTEEGADSPISMVEEKKEMVLGDAPEGYFSDALFIGDSRTDGLAMYSSLRDEADFATKTSLSIYQLFEWDLFYRTPQNPEKEDLRLLDLLAKKQYKKIYLSIGINELGTRTENYIAAFSDALQTIHSMQPDAILYVEAIMHVTAEKSARDTTINNANIEERNDLLSGLADDQVLFYIDMNEAVCDAEGNLKRELTNDGVHLKATEYEIWVAFLRSHAIMEETVYHSSEG